MNRPDKVRRGASWSLAMAAVALLFVGADEPKQTVDARGLTFEAPKSWKSTPPTSQMRRAQLKVEPIEGDEYPAELVVFAFPAAPARSRPTSSAGRASSRTRTAIAPKIETKTVKGKNVEVVRAETHGEYHPASVRRPVPEPDRKVPGSSVRSS